MKAILLDEAKKWLEENCENLYTRMAVFGLMQGMPTVDYQEEPNEPLTLERLREMDGEPVYCINIDDYSTKEWMIVGKDDCEGRRYIFDFSTYSRNWLAYRSPPEGEEDT